MVSFTRVAITVYWDIQDASYTHVVENISISVQHKIFEIKKIDIGLTRRKKGKKTEMIQSGKKIPRTNFRHQNDVKEVLYIKTIF